MVLVFYCMLTHDIYVSPASIANTFCITHVLCILFLTFHSLIVSRTPILGCHRDLKAYIIESSCRQLANEFSYYTIKQ